MSLRTKTLLVFVSFVTLPLILVGFAFSTGLRTSVEQSIQETLENRARTVAAGLELEVSRTRAELERISSDPEVLATIGRALSDGSVRTAAGEVLARDQELSALLDSIQVRAADGSILFSAGFPRSAPRENRLCAPGDLPVAELERRFGVEGGSELSIVGYLSPTAFLSTPGLADGQSRGQTFVVNRRNGAFVVAGPCESGEQVPSRLAALADEVGSEGSASARSGRAEERPDGPGTRSGNGAGTAGSLVASFDLEDPPWTVAATVSRADVGVPLDRLGVAYAALVLLVAAAAAMAFNLLGGRLFRSFHELRDAVEQIGEGDFAPWLPPPGRDEIGWLSLSLGRMAQRMNHMVQSVEQFGRLAVLGEMAAHVAHEIRTPLSSIKLNLQRLERDVEAGTVPERCRASIETGIREVDRLEGTVRNILQLGPPGQDRPRRPRSLHELISQAVDVMRDWIEDRDLSLSLDLAAESDRVRVDPGRTRGIFLNLLMNAAEATPEGGEISVETRLVLREDGKQMVAAAVSDTGPGVPPTIRNEIFNPFFTTKEDGNGLGLAAALRTAREHGGDLFLSDRSDGLRGGCFVVVLPLFPGYSTESDDVDEYGALSGGKWLRSEYHSTTRTPSLPWRPSRGKAEKGQTRIEENGEEE